jgi:hypothetical protein
MQEKNWSTFHREVMNWTESMTQGSHAGQEKLLTRVYLQKSFEIWRDLNGGGHPVTNKFDLIRSLVISS